jgi:hypothetical protein
MVGITWYRIGDGGLPSTGIRVPGASPPVRKPLRKLPRSELLKQ